MKSSGISLQTLVISSAAAVAAAVIIPTFWEQGTLVATAMTPIIVALVSEGLRRPAEKITAVTPKVASLRARPVTSEPEPEPFDPLPPTERDLAPSARPDDPYGLRTRGLRPKPHHWRIALATGLAAFAIAVVGLTASELVFGGPATRETGRTTIFGGADRNRADEAEETPEATTTPSATATPEAEETPVPTPTPTATPIPTPTATPPPAAAPQSPAPAAPAPTP